MRDTADATEDKEGSLSSSEQSDLTEWMKSQLGLKAAKGPFTYDIRNE